jgi:hypothetical protein
MGLPPLISHVTAGIGATLIQRAEVLIPGRTYA